MTILRQTRRVLNETYRPVALDPRWHFYLVLRLSLAYFAILFFLVMSWTLSNLLSHMEDSIGIKVVVKDGTTGMAILGENLTGLREVRDIKFVLGNKLDIPSGDSPFRSSTSFFFVRTENLSPDSIGIVLRTISQFPDVEDVVYSSEMVDHVHELTSRLRVVGFAVGSIVIVLSLLVLISNTRLCPARLSSAAVVMRRLGGSRLFIGTPAVFWGAASGLVSSGLAVGGLQLAAHLMGDGIADAGVLSATRVALFVVLCTGLPGLAALLAMSRGFRTEGGASGPWA